MMPRPDEQPLAPGADAPAGLQADDRPAAVPQPQPVCGVDDLTVTRRDFLERATMLAAGVAAATALKPFDGFARGGLNAGSAAAERAGDPLPASARVQSGELELSNTAIVGSWSVADHTLRVVRFEDVESGVRLQPSIDAFQVILADGRVIGSSGMRVIGEARVERLSAVRLASRLSERIPGRAFALTLEDAQGLVRAEWRAVLRDGSRYLRQEVTFRALRGKLPVKEIALADARSPSADPRVAGEVHGSPIVAGPLFLALEHPLALSRIDGDRHARSWLPRELPLRPESPLTLSSVVGASRSGQLRRDFLAYVERERAHPYRPFLHYNSWYDIGYFSKYDEAAALAVIRAYGQNLVRRRGVALSSFLFDDGWDDPATLWGFHSGFPRGFSRVRALAARYGTAPGVWLSPWGGYGKPKQERLRFGGAQGFETNEGGFALSGPRYYRRFRATCVDMIRRYGVNQFKIDGTGNVASAIAGSEFDSDFDAAIRLIADLRSERPDLFVNLTTGTYPSPFWLWHADSTWRGGEDHDFAGVGSWRQKWITYRDADTFAGVVRKGPLYPLNSLMLHGLIYARHAKNLDADPTGDFDSEVRDYFATGTQLQEMYVTPALLKASDWDAIAAGARWSRRNAATLVDSHWIGGDPARLEAYGWGAWSPGRPGVGIITLRNPADRPQSFGLDPATALELPEGGEAAPGTGAALDPRGDVVARDPWRPARPLLRMRGGTDARIDLAPFEVRTLQISRAPAAT